MTKRNQRAYDKWAATYDSDPNPHTLLEHSWVVRAVAAHRGDVILDAACGTGRYAEEFLSKTRHVTGLDFSREMLALAKRKCPQARFIRGDITRNLPFAANRFDKINCAQTLKHIRRLGPVLKEFHRILKPGGTFTFSVTHPDMNWEGYEGEVRPSFVLAAESDIHHHRFCDYLEAIESAGFRIAAIKQVPVSEKIRHLLTKKSFKKVKGRYQIVIFSLQKDKRELSNRTRPFSVRPLRGRH